MPRPHLGWGRVVFKPDIPITKRTDDLLGRAPFSRAFGKALLEYTYQESIVTALYGGWGSGKSSIMNMTREYIQEESDSLDAHERPVLIEFNPWNHADQNQLISQFFRVLSGALDRQDYGGQASEIGKKLEAYSHFFTPLAMIPDPSGVGNALAVAARQGFKAVGKAANAWGAAYSKDLQQVRGELNKLLATESRKIIIVIDDIDRLPDIEIRQIFQLVKMLGDFPNTIYILSFDRDVVSRALDQVQKGAGGAYLEKIVQFPVEVPPIGRAELEKLLFSQLDEIVRKIPEDRWDQTYWGNIYQEGVKPYFRSLRDVTRYVNTLKFSFEMVRTEVNAIDFIAMTTFQVFEPSLYFGIRDNKDLFAGHLSRVGGGWDEQRQQARVRLDELIKRITVLKQEEAQRFLSRLFPMVRSVYENIEFDAESMIRWRRMGRICHPENFDTFYRLAIPQGDISKSEITAILELAADPAAFTEALRGLVETGRIIRFMEVILDYTGEDIPIENVPNIVRVLMNIGDSFPEEQTGMFDVDTSMKILRVFYQLGKRYQTQEERYELLRSAMEGAEESLWTVVHEVGLLGQQHGKATTNDRLSPEDERTISSDQLALLEEISLRKIREWVASGQLSSHREFAAILYSWKRLLPEGSDELSVFIRELIETREGLLVFVTAFLRQSTSQTMGDSVGRRNWRIEPNNISDFTDAEDVTARLRDVKASAGFEELEERQQIAVKLYLDTVDGKVERW